MSPNTGPLRLLQAAAPGSGHEERADAGRARTGPFAEDSSAEGAATIDEVVRVHLPALVRYATVLTEDPHTAGDIVGEVLLRAHTRWARIAVLERPDLYLRRMVTNEHLSWRRRWHVRSIRPVSDDALHAAAAPSSDHAQRLVEGDALWRRLSALTARQRAVLVLRYYEELDDAEIATVLATSRATVRSHASQALAALRAQQPADSKDTP